MIYGRDRDRGIRMKPGSVGLEAVTIGENGVGEDDLIVHDETNRDLALLLASMETPEMPVALGVLYCQPGPSYEVLARQQMDEAAAARPGANIDGLLRQGYTWTVQN